MRTRLQSSTGLTDVEDCKVYAEAVSQRLEKRLVEEKAQ
jgi:hypothetical protein